MWECLDRTLNDFHLNINDLGLLLISPEGKLIPYISISISFASGTHWNLGGGERKVTLWDDVGGFSAVCLADKTENKETKHSLKIFFSL